MLQPSCAILWQIKASFILKNFLQKKLQIRELLAINSAQIIENMKHEIASHPYFNI